MNIDTVKDLLKAEILLYRKAIQQFQLSNKADKSYTSSLVVLAASPVMH